MLHQLTFILLLLTSLHPGIPQEDENVNATLQSMNTLLGKLVTKSNTQLREIYQLKVQMENDLTSLKEELNNVSDCLQEHKQQTAAKLDELNLKSDFKLDMLKNSTVQLSTDHQQIQTSISDVECMDTEESEQIHNNLQDNLTQQLNTIQSYVEQLPVHTCGGTGGWRRVVYLDMTDPSTTCPSGWQETGYSKRTCGRVSTERHTCDSVTFHVSGGSYSRVCGRIKAYQYGATLGFVAQNSSINAAYATGVSVTHGNPREHIWTFVAGFSEGIPFDSANCPCYRNRISIPMFVSHDYFCESGVNELWNWNRHENTLHTDHPLWDGEDCVASSTCCTFQNPPYFNRQLPVPTSDDIEARICNSFGNASGRTSDVPIELLEFYVQ